MSAPSTPSAPFENKYTQRLVAEKDKKPCTVCCRPTTAVLTTSNSQDFFYVCLSHLKDRTFAEVHPDEAEAIEAKRKEKIAAAEREKVVKEFRERQKKKEKKEKKDDKDKIGEAKVDAEKELPDHPQVEEVDDEPRVFKLNAQKFATRLNRLRSIILRQRAAQVQRQIQDFPTVPAGPP